METFWNEQRTIRLKYLFGEGVSYSEIAKDIGAASRNAISGKVDRLGLSRGKPIKGPAEIALAKAKAASRNLKNRRVSRGTETFQPSREKKMHQEAPTTPPPPFEGSLNIPTRDLRDWMEKSPNQCRFIADEPPGPDYLACGNETADGASYCPHCLEITHRSAANISDEDRARRAAHFRKMGRNPQIIVTSGDITEEAA